MANTAGQRHALISDCFMAGTAGAVKRRMITKKAMTALNLLNTMKNSLPKIGSEDKATLNAADVWTDPHVFAEKKREMQDMFNVFDEDNGGTIDKAELSHLLSMMGVGKSEEDRDRIFKQLDAGDGECAGDGEIDFEEFFNWIATNTATEEEVPDDERLEEMADQLFEMINVEDADGESDDVITPMEFFQCIQKLAGGKEAKMDLSLEDIEALIRDVDEDNDGNLNKEEFAKMILKFMGSE